MLLELVSLDNNGSSKQWLMELWHIEKKISFIHHLVTMSDNFSLVFLHSDVNKFY